jgi:hypothetical protein
MNWLVMLLAVIVLVAIAQYVDGLFRLVFYILAAVVAVYAVIRLTGIG